MTNQREAIERAQELANHLNDAVMVFMTDRNIWRTEPLSFFWQIQDLLYACKDTRQIILPGGVNE